MSDRVRSESWDGAGRVLLADDDRELRHLLATELRKDGFVVTEASTGVELRHRLDDGDDPFDLIVTDVRMPGMTGLTVIDGLRNGNPRSKTPVILITAFGDAHTHAEAKRLKVVVLDKPFDLDDFRSCAANMMTLAEC